MKTAGNKSGTKRIDVKKTTEQHTKYHFKRLLMVYMLVRDSVASFTILSLGEGGPDTIIQKP